MDKSYQKSPLKSVLSVLHSSDRLTIKGNDRSRVSGENGFTLIELMIVTALIGIISAIAFPQLKEFLPGIRIKGAARELALEMNLAKVRAISENKYYFMKFESPSGGPWQYKIYADNGNKTFDASSDQLIKSVSLPAGIRFGVAGSSIHKVGQSDYVPADGITFSTDSASFMSSGRGEAGGAYLIPAEDSGIGRRDRMMAVVISSTTFKISVYKYAGSTWSKF